MSRTRANSDYDMTPVARAALPIVGFRPDIEGLRGVCVAAVVLYHAFPSALPGGFTGVDVFFVISGFLITQLLLREFKLTGRFDLADFWARRARRILPAATFVLCGTALIALTLAAIDARLLGRNMIAAALFYYNWRQAGEAVDYLAADDRDNPLLHYWSLAVEEQFYLAWPLLLTAVAFWRRYDASWAMTTLVAALIAVLAIASFALCVYLTATNAPLAFFSTFSRSWQLLTGAFFAVISVQAKTLRPRLAGAIGISCILALLASFIWITAAASYPGYAALVPTGAAALLLHFGASRTSWASVGLAAAPLRYVGRISFSWYLWHWPLLVFGKAVLAENIAVSWIAIFLSFCLASVTYRFVEKPIRWSATLRTSRRRTLGFGLALISLGAGAGLAMKSYGPDSVPVGAGAFISGNAIKFDRPIIYRDRCMLRIDDVQYSACEYGATSGNKTVVLFGDSHAGNWFSALNEAAKKQNWRLLVRVKASCRPIEARQFRRDGLEYHECAAWRRAVIDELRALTPNLIVIAAMADNLPAEGEMKIIQRLADMAPTVVMRDTPALPETPATCLRRTGDPLACTWRFEDVRSRTSYPITREAELPKNARILDLNKRICPQGICRAVTDQLVLMTDKHHISDSFSATLADEFEKLLEQRTD